MIRATELRTITQKITRKAADDIRKFTAAKNECFEALQKAKHKVEHLFTKFAKTQIIQNIRSHSSDIQDLIEKSNTTALAIDTELQLVVRDIYTLEQSREPITTKLNEAKSAANDYLITLPEFHHLRSLQHDALSNLNTVEKQSTTLCDEVSIKLVGFQNHSIFSYLHTVRYGTEQYHPNLLTRKIDDWIAQKYNFNELRQDYRTLKQMEAAAREALEAAQKQYQSACNNLQIFEADALDTDAMRLAKSEYDRFETELSLAKECQYQLEFELEKHRTLSLDGQLSAIALLVDSLSSLPMNELKALAQSTDSIEDDHALSEIERLLAIIKGHELTLDQCHASLIDANRRHDKSQSLEELLSNSKYSNEDYVYSDTHRLERTMLGFVAGLDSTGDLLNALSMQSRYEPIETHRPYKSESPNFSTTESFGSGSFSTTDRF